MRIKTLFLSCVMAFLSMSVVAQESINKQINQIKRDNAYLYAEATLSTEEEALSVAKELLLRQVQEYVETKPELSKSETVLVKDINSSSESMSMMRGEMYRVFVYVKKSDIEAISNAMAISKTTTVQPVPVKQSTVTSESVKETPRAPIDEQPAQPVMKPVESPSQPVSTTPNHGASSDRVLDSVQRTMPSWQMQAIQTLLECNSVEAVASRLGRLKTEYKVKKYGTSDNCPSLQDVYLVFFGEKGNVIDVLGPGKSQRVGFKNMEIVSIDKFIGTQSLWFTFAK